MKPVHQTILYTDQTTGNGDCFDAALASLLEVPLWMVPPFHKMYGRTDRHTRIDQWLIRMFGMWLDVCDFSERNEEPELPEFYIAVGQSPRDPASGHAVVYLNGVLVHDPHPFGGGVVGEPRTIYFLRKVLPKEVRNDI